MKARSHFTEAEVARSSARSSRKERVGPEPEGHAGSLPGDEIGGEEGEVDAANFDDSWDPAEFAAFADDSPGSQPELGPPPSPEQSEPESQDPQSEEPEESQE